MLNSTFKIVFFIEVLAITSIRSYYTLRKSKRPIKSSSNSKMDKFFLAFEVIGMLIPFIYILSPILDFANYKTADWVGWSGASLFLMAILLLWRSHFDLGEYWFMDLSITNEHKLIKTGSYKYIRHPLYTSHMIWAIAQILMLNNWIAGFSFFVVFLPHCLYRIGIEEQMMNNEFGEEYYKYTLETGRMFPKLSRRRLK